MFTRSGFELECAEDSSAYHSDNEGTHWFEVFSNRAWGPFLFPHISVVIWHKSLAGTLWVSVEENLVAFFWDHIVLGFLAYRIDLWSCVGYISRIIRILDELAWLWTRKRNMAVIRRRRHTRDFHEADSKPSAQTTSRETYDFIVVPLILNFTVLSFLWSFVEPEVRRMRGWWLIPQKV
jgi:hypothetical protein